MSGAKLFCYFQICYQNNQYEMVNNSFSYFWNVILASSCFLYIKFQVSFSSNRESIAARFSLLVLLALLHWVCLNWAPIGSNREHGYVLFLFFLIGPVQITNSTSLLIWDAGIFKILMPFDIEETNGSKLSLQRTDMVWDSKAYQIECKLSIINMNCWWRLWRTLQLWRRFRKESNTLWYHERHSLLLKES